MADLKKQDASKAMHYPVEMPLKLATAYIPPQRMIRETFTLTEALNKGTLFPELYRPYPY